VNSIFRSAYKSTMCVISGAVVALLSSTMDSHVGPRKIVAGRRCPQADDVERVRWFVDGGLALGRKPWPCPYEPTA
jgi:hypothetical protein